MMVKVILGAVDNGKAVHVAGTESAIFDAEDKEAKRLADLGIVEIVSRKDAAAIDAEAKAKADAEAKAAADAAAEVRAANEAKAFELKLGTEAEIKALKDEDLAKLLEGSV